MCGPRTYTLLNSAGKPLQNNELSLTVVPSWTEADDLTLSMTTLAQGKEYLLDI